MGGQTVVGSVDLATRRDAERAALRECKTKGGANCKIIMYFGNACGVMVWGKTHWEVASGATVAEAARPGLERCNKVDDDCRIYYSACSLPRRVQ